jgi:hypothetical protein
LCVSTSKASRCRYGEQCYDLIVVIVDDDILPSPLSSCHAGLLT